MYKNKNIARLTALIRTHELPDWDEVDWVALYRQHVKDRAEADNRPLRYAADPDVHRYLYRARTANSRAKRHGAEGIVTPEDLDSVMARCNEACVRCGTTEHLVFDHVIPYYKGGTNWPDNLQVLCRICNMEKGVGA